MSSLPSVAVVILNWNGKKFLQQFLPSVVASTYKNYKIVVADNGSTDDSINFLQQHYPQVQVLKNDLNEGFAKGYNTALKQISADYYVLLNSDVEVESNWLEPVIELMQADNKIGACQPKILSQANKDQFEYAGACGGWIDKFGYPFNRGRIFETCEFDTGQYDDVQQIFWASGAAFFVRSEVFHLLGGFDEYFFAHQEEIDLCWRMQLAGYKIYVQPAAKVYHVGGGTLPEGRQKTYLNFRNNLVMLSKNLSAGEALRKIPFRIFLDNVAAWQSLFSGNSVRFPAIYKAHLHYVKWLLSKKQSKKIQQKYQHPAGIYQGSIIWQYFIKKKRTFSEIL